MVFLTQMVPSFHVHPGRDEGVSQMRGIQGLAECLLSWQHHNGTSEGKKHGPYNW